jgi:hypothetical protein
MRVTRRELAGLLASAPLAAQAPAPQPQSAAEELKAASDRVRRNTATLSKFPVPVATEPAFTFKA